MFIDVHTAMLKASQNKNVLSCRLKAAWDDVLRIDYLTIVHTSSMSQWYWQYVGW